MRQLGNLALKIRLDGWLLWIAPVLLDPAAQRRKADAKICRHLLTRQTAAQRYPQCLCAELRGCLLCHDGSPLSQNTKSKEPNNSVKAPEASDRLANLGVGKIDIAVRFGDPPFVPDKKVQLFSAIRLCAVCTPVLAGRIGKVSSPERLFEHRLVEDGQMRWSILADEIQVALRHKPKRLNQTSLAIKAGKSGAGIALAPYVLVASELKSQELTKIWQSTNNAPEAYHLIYPKNPTETQKRVIEWMAAEAQNHSYQED